MNHRLEKVKTAISKLGIDGIYITNITNVRYLSGFTGSAGSILILNDKEYFYSDGRYIEQSKKEVKNFEICIDNDSHLNIINKNGHIKNNKIAFEAIHTSVSSYNQMKSIFSNCNWVPTEGIIELIAAVKDKDEIESLKQAVEITDKVFDEILPELKIGAKEIEISARISYLFKKFGAEGDSYDPIIASGWRGALPHARPTDKKFENGDFVVMDFGALYNGYHADMTRTVLIGDDTDQHHEIYNIVLESQLAGVKFAKAGVTGKELDSACRDIINDKGYGDKFIHSTGHGLGLEVHTYPRISQINKKPLLENYVVTIEPGIYIPNWGGVRIEDDCWIRKEQCVPLNRSTKELLIL